MLVKIIESDFDPYQAVSDYQANSLNAKGQFGATAVFVGTMRDFNEGDNVSEMVLEHYPGMTEKHLESICQQSIASHGLIDTLVIHRVGSIKPDEAIVLVAVWSGHRKQAFEACREIMEDLKSKAPFWKKESLNDGGQRWVEKNTQGY